MIGHLPILVSISAGRDLTSEHNSERESKLNDLLLQWEHHFREGQNLPAVEICEDCPELAADLQLRIDILSSRFQHVSTIAGSAATEYVPIPGLSDALTPTDDEFIFTVAQYGEFQFHARGGLGEVFVAGDRDLKREVALKFINKDSVSDGSSQSQFQLEAEVAAQLEHPGVVPVYGLGQTSDGRPFQVMRYIRGTTFADAIREYFDQSETLTPSERVVQFRRLISCFISVCKTIAYAHSRGVVHRDIKPDNIMLGKYGETLVVDWGLAVLFERDKEASQASDECTIRAVAGNGDSEEGVVAGTPAYMSPEQADGRPDIQPPSDIYSLGVLLYQVLTGNPAFEAAGVVAILQKVRQNEFTPPRQAHPQVPAPLESICLKAMQLKPEDRYDSALDMANDLENWMADEPVSVHQETKWQLAVRWARHHQRLTQAALMLLMAILVAGTVWATAEWDHRNQLLAQRIESIQAKADVEEEILKADFDLLRQDIAFLANRKSIHTIVRHESMSSTENQELDEAQLELAELFQDFLSRRPSYMQARFLDRNGQEIVRVDRKKPGASVQSVTELQNKKDRPYFTETMALPPGQVYLSAVDLNQEHGKKQWDFPVIRAAVPVRAEKGEPQGIVIINMHFDRIAELVKSRTDENLLVFLTNEEGQFLLHPTAKVAFCFERGLSYPIEATYPPLRRYLLNDLSESEPQSVTPRFSLLIERTSEKTDLLKSLVAELGTDFPDLRDDFSDEGDMVMLMDLKEDQLRELKTRIERDFPDQVKVYALPRPNAGSSHTVYCRKIYFDRDRPERFLGLIFAVP